MHVPIESIAQQSARRPLSEVAASLSNSPVFAYSTVLIVQLRMIWKIGRYKDLTTGDTCSYFDYAWHWSASHQFTNIIYSPLYTVFYGTMISFCHDAFAATILHRVIIVMISTALVLAVMRQLLPSTAAWFVAVWWAVVPIHFDAWCEVHQFVVIPVLAAWLVAARPNAGPWTRGCTLALLTATTVLVRYEIAIALGVLGIYCLWTELGAMRRDFSLATSVKLLCGYLIPLLIVISIIAWFFDHSLLSLSEAMAMLHDKQTTTMAQWYAFGYQQRHPEWTKIPWDDYRELSSRIFGVADPTIPLMLRGNGAELLSHIGWNYRQVPTGLQLSLFNCAAGSINPDIRLNNVGRPVAWVWSALVILAVIVGAGFWRFRSPAMRTRLNRRRFGWFTLFATLAAAPLMLITSPPRPEIFFCQSLVLMALIGLAMAIIAENLPRRPWLAFAVPIALAAILVFEPFDYRHIEPQSQPLRKAYERLRPYESLIDRPGVVTLYSRWELKHYIGHGDNVGVVYDDLISDWPSQESLAAALDRRRIDLFFLDRNGMRRFDLSHPGAIQIFIDKAEKRGWTPLHCEPYPGARWMLFQRIRSPH
ncbi:MAG TPA: hypothetical protein VFC46_06120 [Humisphaera sp.]|nr:hypothetical protein [Humisphaera sp.]